ncbi:hypothetical protein J6590_068036 [Homalodisca vitripennis]|nr:hypothetical protein J6590_068036 [Homalodisca vitripennis]
MTRRQRADTWYEYVDKKSGIRHKRLAAVIATRANLSRGSCVTRESLVKCSSVLKISRELFVCIQDLSRTVRLYSRSLVNCSFVLKISRELFVCTQDLS